MPSKYTEILEFKQFHKSDKAPFIINPDLESLTEKIDGHKHNSGNFSRTKTSKNISIRFFNVYNIIV